MKKLLLLVAIAMSLVLVAAPAFACDYNEPPQEETQPPPVERVKNVTYVVTTNMPFTRSAKLVVPEGTGFSVVARATSFIVTFSSGDVIVADLERFRNNPTQIRVRRDGQVLYFGDQNGALERRRG